MDMQHMIKQAQTMQKKMDEIQQRIAGQEYEGESGGGLVKVTVNGKGELLSLKIDPSLLDAKEAEVLEDLIVAAFNQAKKTADDDSSSAMNGMMGDMGIPSGFKMPF